ncbi:hypothetical protein [Mesorhizobium sp.]|uniref:hypothetical protein n=1 Tax=Mesorhizobium sp. TaxID=1871066 RepID=UPI0025BAB0DF|nr:hypothetical protein [Mesorhizobium sp.]
MTDFEDKTMRNYRSNNAVALAAENRSGVSRRMTPQPVPEDAGLPMRTNPEPETRRAKQ